MGELEIRDATQGDVEALAGLMTELGYPASAAEMGRRFKEVSADPSYATLVAERDCTVLGMALVHLERTYDSEARVARIISFVVGSGERGGGVGRRLISAVEDWAEGRGARYVMLTAHTRRDGAHAFYRNVGYEMTGYRFIKEI